MTIIYVVKGISGCFEDTYKWDVCWRTTQEEAEQVKALCQAQARDFYDWAQANGKDYHVSRRSAAAASKRREMFDSRFECDWDRRTEYYVHEVPEDPWNDPIDFPPKHITPCGACQVCEAERTNDCLCEHSYNPTIGCWICRSEYHPRPDCGELALAPRVLPGVSPGMIFCQGCNVRHEAPACW